MTTTDDDRSPFTAFDWDYADQFEDSARRTALDNRPAETDILMSLAKANSLIHFGLLCELSEHHPVAEMWLESQTDLLASVYLAYGGFFRQALAIVRSWFEIAVHALFFSAHYGQPTGARNAPANMPALARSLANRPDKLVNIDESTILAKLDPIYSFLCEHVHAQGVDVHNLQQGRDIVPRYLPRSFEVWYEKLLEAFDSVCFLYKLFFSQHIASHLAKSETEKQSAQSLVGSLSGTLPEFSALMTEALSRVYK